MAADFYQAYVIVHENEKGYAFDPDDPGGETWDGVARKHWPNWDGWKIVDEAKKQYKTKKTLEKHLRTNVVLKQLTTDFFRVNFWEYLNLHVFNQSLALSVFDTAVNFGRKRAVKYLQIALNYLNINEEVFPDLDVDGKLGRNTLDAIKAHLATASWGGRNINSCYAALMDLFISERVDAWKNSMDRNPRMEKYAFGWIRRKK